MGALRNQGWHKASTNLKTSIGFRDQIFPFSENWPANYNFSSLFSKLPTNYPKKLKKQTIFLKIWGVRTVCSIVFFDTDFVFSVNLLVTLKTMKNYNLQANFQKMEKSGL